LKDFGLKVKKYADSIAGPAFSVKWMAGKKWRLMAMTRELSTKVALEG
jgi:hypothetical protein